MAVAGGFLMDRQEQVLGLLHPVLVAALEKKKKADIWGE